MADTTTATTTLRQAPFIEEFQKRLLDKAQGVSNVVQTRPTLGVAGLDPLTQQARGVGAGLGQYQPLLNTGQRTVGSGLATLQNMGQGVGRVFQAGQGTVAGAIQGLGRGPAGAGALGQAQTAIQGAGGQFGGGPNYTAQGFDPNTISQFQNPFEDQAVQQALADIRREGEIASNRQNAAAVQSGAFGGSRDILARGELGRNVLEQQGRTAAGMRQAGFQNAAQQAQAAFADQQRRQQGQSQFDTQSQQQAFEQARQRALQQGQQFTGLGGAQTGQQTQFAQTQAGLGTSLGSLGQAQAQEAARLGLGIGSLGTTQANVANLGQSMLGQQAQVQSQLGALGQQTQQRQLDAIYAQQLAQQAEPSQRYGQFANILKPSINSATSAQQTTVAPSQSGFSQLVGAGIGALGINKAIGNPLGFGS